MNLSRPRPSTRPRLPPLRSKGDSSLEAEFSRIVAEKEMEPLSSRRSPTHLMPPTAIVSAVMEALQRNDWPVQGDGVKVARRFTMPEDATSPTAPTESTLRRSWRAKEAWLDVDGFAMELQRSPYEDLLACDEWRVARPLVFLGKGGDRNRAVQVIDVRRDGMHHTARYTFCLERVPKGSLRDCWLLVGVRAGDYGV